MLQRSLHPKVGDRSLRGSQAGATGSLRSRQHRLVGLRDIDQPERRLTCKQLITASQP